MSMEGEPIQAGDLEDFLGSLNDTGASDPSMNSSVFNTAVDEDIPGFMSGTTDGQASEDAKPLFEGATTVIGDGACRVCGTPTFRPPGLTKAGYKKRVPRYCDLHAPHARVSQDGPDPARLESQLARIQQELADDMLLLGTMAGPLFPVTGYYICENADPFTTALLKLCKNNQRMLRVLHRAASVAPVYEVFKTTAGVAYAVQVDRHQADPHNTIGERLGVGRSYDAVYNPDNQPDTAPLSSNGYNPPPHYAGVQ